MSSIGIITDGTPSKRVRRKTTKRLRGFTQSHLGKQSQDAIDVLDVIPWKGGPLTVELNCTEFTSHCPVTKQPDFGKLVITYRPRDCLVETKSLKLFLWRYRNVAMFNEAIVADIALQFAEQVHPHFVKVTGEFNTRGGISVTAESTRHTNGLGEVIK